MKTKFYTLIFAALATANLFGQAVFNNAAGDGLWSNTGNWYLNNLPDDNTHATVNEPVTLDVNATAIAVRSINQIVNNGVGKISIVGAVSGPALRQLSGVDDQTFVFDAAMEINATGAGTNRYLEVQGTRGKLNLGPNSKLTLISFAEVIALKTDGRVVNFNGKIDGSGLLRFGSNSKSIFGDTSNNSDYEGTMIFFTSSEVISNTADGGIFLKAGKRIQANNTNGILTFNGANNMKGDFAVLANVNFTVNINKNQNNMGAITLALPTTTPTPVTTLNININNVVTEVFFANCSAIDWGTGVVNITGYKQGVIRFGTDATGLTSAQLSKINVGGQAVKIDANGYLVNNNPLSVNKNDDFSHPRISYPTLTTGILYFKQPVNNFKILSITGSVLKEVRNEVSSIDFSDLTSGLYFIKYSNNSVEKIIKK